MYIIAFIFSSIICLAEKFQDLCDDHCDIHTLVDVEFEYKVPNYQHHLSCPKAIEAQNQCFIEKTDSFEFSGVKYDEQFFPVWHLTINGKEFDSHYHKMQKLIVGDSVIYDISRDDIRYWYDHNTSTIEKLYDLKVSTDCHDRGFIDAFRNRFHIPERMSGHLIYSFISYANADWRNHDLTHKILD